MRRGISRSSAGVALVFTFMHGQRSGGQELARGVRVTAENDYFNFWLPPGERSDDNYTQGLRVSWEAGVPLFVRRFVCHDVQACASTIEIGQEIFTPTDDAASPIPGQRPYAGCLYARATALAATEGTRRSLGVTVGVTGVPSLAAQTQEIFHQLVLHATSANVKTADSVAIISDRAEARPHRLGRALLR